MARQASMIGNGTVPRPDGVLEGVGAFGSNLTNLVLLQARLALLDFRDGSTRAGMWYALLGAAIVLVPGGTVLAIAGIAMWIAEATSLTVGQSLVLVSSVSVVLGMLGAYLAVRMLKKSYSTFRRSREEFERNLAWVKTVIAQSGRS